MVRPWASGGSEVQIIKENHPNIAIPAAIDTIYANSFYEEAELRDRKE